MNTITIDELQSNFEQILSQVENGKSFIVKSEYGNVALVPYDTYKEIDDLVKIYTDHEEGC
jgi:antitoxin (DNA-binding transcriptional repressor) of toxin-antitoxin stability system